MKFNERSAFITGAAGRIGRAVAAELGKYGVELYLADVRADVLEEVVEEFRKRDFDAHPVLLDVTDPGQIAAAAKSVLREAGKIDILVNNAGQWPAGTILATDDATWSRVIELNLTGVFRVSRAFLPSMTERRYGRIINLGSIAGEVGLPGYCAYASAKGGVIMLTKTMAMELAPFGITVNSVSPGLILDGKLPTTGTWLGRTGTGDEVARAIAFLAADDSDYITGVDMPVDGGRILGPKMTVKS